MNKQETIQILYPEHDQLFEFDTALPLYLMRDIKEKVFPNVQPGTKEAAEKHQIIYSAVYAYGKQSDRCSGLIPLTMAARNAFSRYQQITGANVIFTPVIDSYNEAKEKKYKKEYEHLTEFGHLEGIELDEYIQHRDFLYTQIEKIAV